jgi:hypothetical protein
MCEQTDWARRRITSEVPSVNLEDRKRTFDYALRLGLAKENSVDPIDPKD